jgi:parvulin-like peptidyl-prolyl isomerase
MPVKKAAKRRSTAVKKTPKVLAPVTVKKFVVSDKLKQPKVFVGLVVVVLVIAAFLLKGLFVAAIVNGQPISRFTVISELEKQGGKQALTSLINQDLIFQEAAKKKITFSQSEVNASLKQIQDSLAAQGQDLDTALATQGMTKQDLLTQLKLRGLVEKLLADKITVSDKEISDYIQANKSTLPTNMTDAELKSNVADQLKQQKLGTASQAWLDQLNKDAKINYFVSY